MLPFRWYVRRLGAMSLPELAHRARSAVLVQTERLHAGTPWPGDEALWRGLGGTGRPDWPSWAADGSQRARLEDLDAGEAPASFTARFPAGAAALRAWADATLGGRARVFAHVVEAGWPPDWHADAVNGRRWPRERFYADIDFRSGGAKAIWEPSRHQQLSLLAVAAWALREPRYVDGLSAALSHWLASNPFLRGVHWTSGLELALRLASWVWIDALLHRQIGAAGLRREWARAIVAHAVHIERHLSRFSSANNHLIGEAAGLVFAASLVPGWYEAPDWRRRGWAILTEEIERQILPDGSPAEQATHYLEFITDFYLMLLRTAPPPDTATVTARLERAGRFLGALIGGGGDLPRIGDEDGGRAFAVSLEPLSTRGRIAAIAAACRTDLPGAGDLEPASWLLLHSSRRALAEPAGRPGAPADAAFADGGYWTLAGGGEPPAHAVVDCGPLGYLSIAAHGHADCLAVCLNVGGEWLIVDPGTYVYHEQPEWRTHFRGTRAHNTVAISSEDQSVQTGATMWGARAHATPIAWEVVDGVRWFEGRHDGYRRLATPVTHRRGVAMGHGYLVVVDRVDAACDGEATWQFAAGCLAEQSDGIIRVIAPSRRELRLAFSGPAAVRVANGDLDPPRGWVSPAFGERQPAPAAVASGALDPAVPWITVVTYAPPSRVAFERREGLIHVVVTGGGRRETLVLDAARLERTLVAVARETSQVRS